MADKPWNEMTTEQKLEYLWKCIQSLQESSNNSKRITDNIDLHVSQSNRSMQSQLTEVSAAVAELEKRMKKIEDQK